MVKMTVQYDGELRCTATHGPSNCRIETDAPADNHGKAQRFSPTDLMGAALAACIATTMNIRGEGKGWKLEGMRLAVQKEMSSDPPRRVVKLPVEIWMPAGFPVADRPMAEDIANNCPVQKSLHPGIAAPVTFHW